MSTKQEFIHAISSKRRLIDITVCVWSYKELVLRLHIVKFLYSSGWSFSSLLYSIMHARAEIENTFYILFPVQQLQW